MDAGLPADPWTDAVCAAALLAVDPVGLGGVRLRASAGAVRERWLAGLKALLPQDVALRRVPLAIGDERLLGGLDLAATLQAGRPVAQRGLLAEADGGLLLLAMAERLSGSTAAKLAAAMDTGEVVLERDGLALRREARFGVVALDEGLEPDERVPAALADRLAFHLEPPVRVVAEAPDATAWWTREDIAAARTALPRVRVDDAIVEALCAATLALGIDSARAPLLALRAARAAAALDGRAAVVADDAALAARLVLGPRATRLPPAEADTPPEEDAAPPPPEEDRRDDEEQSAVQDGPIEDRVLDAAQAAIPAGLLALLALGEAPRGGAASSGRAGAAQLGHRRGRPMGARRGEPRGGARLDLIATLRAAAPWQPLRRRERAPGGSAPRVEVRRDDFHITRLRQRRETTTVFAVDASGSSALHRLAEAKGAVELLLADCYVRRDKVALLAFRGTGAELLLPPTRSLVRAKRGLAALPGGGGTPLAAGLDAAAALVDAVRRRGETPVVVVLTDGRANVARDGAGGRERALADALAAARALRALGSATLLVDTSPQPQAAARQIAEAMGARYLPLPHAGAAQVSLAVRAVSGAPVVGR